MYLRIFVPLCWRFQTCCENTAQPSLVLQSVKANMPVTKALVEVGNFNSDTTESHGT